ncbi:MAG: carbon-nitrogen hydrolase family protein [Thermoanaerobaculia bacterium]|nr:carbon-nitrogen hydrolase family protein [Thermoanaerobaculia bacterium]
MTQIRIAMAQLSSSEDRAANLTRCLEAVDQAAAGGAHLVCFPEVVLDRFFPAEPGTPTCKLAAHELSEPVPGPVTEQLCARAKEHGIAIVFNLYEVDGSAGGVVSSERRYFDTSPVIDSDGTLLGVTRMIHITDYDGFHEQDYYDPGDTGAPVYEVDLGGRPVKVGVAICYDRHYPEYMRGLAVAGAELVVIPQAGTLGEWPEGLYEAEIRTAAFQNGYFAALCNRVGVEKTLTFAGESFVSDPEGIVLARGKSLEDDLVFADLDLSRCAESNARQLFFRDRRPELYSDWLTSSPASEEKDSEEKVSPRVEALASCEV